MKVYNEKKIFVLIPEKFDKQGNLTHEDTRNDIKDYLVSFKKFIEESQK